MAETQVHRYALVCRTTEQKVWLRAQRACSGCLACGGRCAVWAAESEVALPRRLFAEDVVPGDRVTLVMHAPDLLRDAWRGYGFPLLGMLVGAALGAALAAAAGVPADAFWGGWRPTDAASLVGAASGTLWAMLASKQPRIRVERT